jgi:hypothetical protein
MQQCIEMAGWPTRMFCEALMCVERAVQGQSWSVVDIDRDPSAPSTWLIEGALAGADAGPWVLAFRTSVGHVFSTHSEDGLNWTPARATTVPNPNSKACSISLLC